MGGLSGKSALVTGASRGIGRAIAGRLARDGAQIVINYAKNLEQAEMLAQEIRAFGGAAMTIGADVSDLAAVEQMFSELRERIGELDILVNNAGRASEGGFRGFEEFTPQAYDAVFALNTRAVFFVTQGAVKMMRDGGRIINLSSMASSARLPGISAYAATKAAVDAFTRIWAAELAPRAITVNSINPGYVATDFTAGMDPDRVKKLVARVPLGRSGRPEDIAAVAAFLASDDAGWITGSEQPACGGAFF